MNLAASIALFVSGVVLFTVIALVKSSYGDCLKKIHPLIYFIAGLSLCCILFPPESIRDTPQYGERMFTVFMVFILTCILTTVSGQKRKEDD